MKTEKKNKKRKENNLMVLKLFNGISLSSSEESITKIQVKKLI